MEECLIVWPSILDRERRALVGRSLSGYRSDLEAGSIGAGADELAALVVISIYKLTAERRKFVAATTTSTSTYLVCHFIRFLGHVSAAHFIRQLALALALALWCLFSLVPFLTGPFSCCRRRFLPPSHFLPLSSFLTVSFPHRLLPLCELPFLIITHSWCNFLNYREVL